MSACTTSPTLTDAGVLARHPRPWHTTANQVRDAKGVWIATTRSGRPNPVFANAALIVAAVNAYEPPEDPTP